MIAECLGNRPQITEDNTRFERETCIENNLLNASPIEIKDSENLLRFSSLLNIAIIINERKLECSSYYKKLTRILKIKPKCKEDIKKEQTDSRCIHAT